MRAHLPLIEERATHKGLFLHRPNRFLAEVEVEGRPQLAHVHDPGRLRELLIPGNHVLLRKANNPSRKTQWDVLAAMGQGGWVFIHSGSHRRLAERLLGDPAISPLGEAKEIKAEVTFGRSRLDFEVRLTGGSKVAVEVKGCTLCVHGAALFPDAPTKRGARHMEELKAIRLSGPRAAVIVFILCPTARCFSPNREMDSLFSRRFEEAVSCGVEIYPVSISYNGRYLYYENIIPICP